MLVIYAVTNGYVDDYPADSVKKYEKELYSFIESKHPEIFEKIRSEKQISDDMKENVNKALDELKAQLGDFSQGD